MKTKLKLHVLFLLAWLSLSGFAHAQGTTIGYQGRLNDGGRPATGLYDFTFKVFDVEAGGVALAGTVVRNAEPVTNGVFSVSLDFGAGVFAGAARWLEISVRTNGVGALVILAPRTPLLPTPYSIFAGSAGNVASGAVTANQLNTGGIAPTPGQFLSYNGGNLAWTAPGVAAGNIWSLNGSSAYYNAGNVGIGTTTPAAGYRLEVSGSTILRPSNGSIQFGSPSGELGMSMTPNLGNRADLRFDGSTLKLLAGPGVGPPSSVNGIVISTAGNVGIGSPSPTAKLEVVAQNALSLIGYQPFLTIADANAGYARGRIQSVGGDVNLLTESYLNGANPFSFLKLANNGNVGIGSATPTAKLEVVAQNALSLIGYQPFLTIADANAGYARGRIQSAGGEMIFAPESYLNGSDGNAYAKLFYSGNFSVKTLTIRGGADLAEPFELSATDIAKGSVVIIDDENPGKLKLSTRAYDTQVAGIVSGANGIDPGISLHQQGALEGGQNVALSGRVYVQADAANGSIKPGDLLTTSGTPGHAMKVTDHTQAQGAILGKAMSALKEGKGMVLVLVTLQ